MMTTLTTVLGLLPSALGFGGNVEMMQSLSVVVMGGLTLSTLVTLILVPTVYLLADGEDRRRKGGRFGMRGLLRRSRREDPQKSQEPPVPEEFR